MKHLSLSIMLAMSGLTAYSATSSIKTLEVDGFERTSVVFTPANSNQQKKPLLLFLHPNGYSAQDVIDNFKLENVCDEMNAVVVVPEALDEQNTEIINLLNLAQSAGVSMPGFSLKYVWNAGARVKTSAFTSELTSQQAVLIPILFPEISSSGYIRFNKDVDDVKFLNTLLDEVAKEQSIDSEKVFVLGASMGGAMTYKYALSPDTKAKGIVVFCGFLGGDVEFDGNLNMPLMAVHSKSDQIVSYEGGLLDIAVKDRVAQFAEANGCTEAIAADVADIADDGISVVRYDYNCESDKRVRFFELDGASHADILRSDYVSGPNDIDYIAESYKFLFGEKMDVEDEPSVLLAFYPNPATDEIHVSRQGAYSICTLDGVELQRGMSDGEAISIADLQKGIYVLSVESGEGRWVSKLIKE